MKCSTLFFILLATFYSYSQSAEKPAKSDRYDLDFSVKGWSEKNLKVLESLDPDQYEHLRADEQDVEVYDPKNKVTIILFSKRKTIENERSRKTYSDYFQNLYIKEN